MRERAYTFGSHQGLVGIVSEPLAPVLVDPPAVLLFNIGLNHHVGPNRLNVDLARHLVPLGFTTLRFDLAGLGDSLPRRDARSDEERAVLDVTEAMDFLVQRKNIRRFVLVGLCSGVDPAHVVAVRDERVVGAVFIDGYAYTTPMYHLRDGADRIKRIFAPENYTRFIRRRVLARLGRFGSQETGQVSEIFDRTFPGVEQFKSDLATMLSRGMRVLCIYTRHAYFFNHASQFASMLGLRQVPQGVEVEYQTRADHMFTSVAERARAIGRIGGWMSAGYGAGSTTGADTSEAALSQLAS